MRTPLLIVLLCTLVPASTAAPVGATPKISAPRHHGSPPTALAASQERVAAAGGYGWPLTGAPPVSRAFDPPKSGYGPGHRGVDLVAAAGSSVRAVGDGTVVFAGELAGRGVVSVQHADGLRTTYEPVTGSVTVGAPVTRGAPLGVLQPGHPGCPAEACLHWGVRRGAAHYLDPLRLLGRWAVRLLPWVD